MELIEDSCESPDGQVQKEVYALFADVSKAYDQVWRSGLYSLLYVYGVRGKMWQIIQQWLDNATATTKWNGTLGPCVPLAEGLRQGCVLSPILYCVFISAMLSTKPSGGNHPSMPDGMEVFANSLFAQGFQSDTTMGVWGSQPTTSPSKTGAPQVTKGLWDRSLMRRVMASLFMDDTTLLANSQAGLSSRDVHHVHVLSLIHI